MPAQTTSSLEDRLWSRVTIREEEDCWEWNGAHNSRGLPMFIFSKLDRASYDLKLQFGTDSERGITAQRVMWGVIVGPVPYNKVVYHKCNNRNCMNPKHLELGSKQDQSDHRIDSERQAVGDSHGKSKLTPSEAREIYQRFFEDEITQSELAQQYNIDDSTVSNIINGHIWSHSTGMTPSFKWSKKKTSPEQHINVWFNQNKDPRWKP